MSVFSKAHREYWRREAATQKAERRAKAATLKAERRAKRHERNMRVLKQYGYIAPISIGAGILTAVAFAIETHWTRSTWEYAISLHNQGYPPLWLWAGVATALVTAGVLFERQSRR